MRNFYKTFILLGMLLALRIPAFATEIPRIEVNVLEIGKKTASVSTDQEHSWFIRCSFPDSSDLKRYTVIQTLSSCLTYVPDSIQIQLMNGHEEFVMGEHYTVTAGSVFVEAGTADRISIALTPAGNACIAEGMELRIEYRAKLNENASLGTQILGTAQLNCLDEAGNRTVCLSDKASVSTGGFPIFLSDSTGSPLSGGTFMVARRATPEEQKTDSDTIELLDTGEEQIAVVYERFCPSSDLQTEWTYIAETDNNGYAICSGLSYGEYYLVQTDTPKGISLPAAPVKVTVNEVSHLTAEDGWTDSTGTVVDHTVRITNGELVMPETGGPGTLGYTASGLIIIVSACMLLWFNRKRRVTA